MPRKSHTRETMPLDTPAIDRHVAIEKTIQGFDFEHVHRVLTAIDGSAPTIEEMRSEATKLVAAAFDNFAQPDPPSYAWNGFRAWRAPGTKDHYCLSGSLNLQFWLAESRETPEPEDPKKSIKSKAIEEVMQRFDFERAHKAMTLREREDWEGELMPLEKLKVFVREMLQDVWSNYPKESAISSGGFHVWRSPGKVDHVNYPKGLELYFVLEYQHTDLTPQPAK